MLLAFSAILFRNGPPEGYSLQTTAVVLSLFWIGGLMLGRFAIDKPCYYASIQNDELTVVWRYPLKTVRRSFPIGLVEPPVVVEGRDSEGDSYFYARLMLPNGSAFDLGESHIRSVCERACENFLEAMNKSETKKSDA